MLHHLRRAVSRRGTLASSSAIARRPMATHSQTVVDTAQSRLDSLKAEVPVSPYANPDWKAPAFPEHKYDPQTLAKSDLSKFYIRQPRTAPEQTGFPHLSFPVQTPTPTNPLINPTTLTEALRSSPLIYPPWTPKSVRVGAIAQKMGMTAVWDDWGNRLPMTVIRLEANQVTQVKNMLSKKGTVGMQIGAGLKSFKNTPKSMIVHCLKAGVLPKKQIREFGVTLDALLPLGTTITARHFVAGQYVDITGTTRGKGFQGAMYRWGFGGQPASHGVSLTHRSIGSIGSNQSPGRVLKGKKMAGHMGNEQRTYENMRVYKIDVKRNLLYIHGSLPGPTLGWLEVRDAKKKKWDPKSPPPFPTYFPKAGEKEPEELVMKTEGLDPNAEMAGL